MLVSVCCSPIPSYLRCFPYWRARTFSLYGVTRLHTSPTVISTRRYSIVKERLICGGSYQMCRIHYGGSIHITNDKIYPRRQNKKAVTQRHSNRLLWLYLLCNGFRPWVVPQKYVIFSCIRIRAMGNTYNGEICPIHYWSLSIP